MTIISLLKKTYHRNLLEKLLKAHKNLIKGKILDIGSKNRRYDHLFEGQVMAADIIPNKELGIEKQDITNLTYPDSSFESIISLETLQYLKLESFTKAISEIERVLKKGGTAIITCPFFYRDHQDNLRVSLNYLNEILAEMHFSEYKIYKIGNKHTAIFDIFRFGFFQKKYKNKLTKFFASIYYLSNLINQFLTIKIFRLEKIEDDFYSGIFIILKK